MGYDARREEKGRVERFTEGRKKQLSDITTHYGSDNTRKNKKH